MLGSIWLAMDSGTPTRDIDVTRYDLLDHHGDPWFPSVAPTGLPSGYRTLKDRWGWYTVLQFWTVRRALAVSRLKKNTLNGGDHSKRHRRARGSGRTSLAQRAGSREMAQDPLE